MGRTRCTRCGQPYGNGGHGPGFCEPLVDIEHVETFTIATDEGRFQLAIVTDQGEYLFDIHAAALDIEEEVRKELGPWAREAAEARHAVRSGKTLREFLEPVPVTQRPVSVEEAVEAGYALDDPKSPGYYDRMVGDH